MPELLNDASEPIISKAHPVDVTKLAEWLTEDLGKLADWLAHMISINTLPMTDPICAQHMANLKSWEDSVRCLASRGLVIGKTD